MNQNLACFLLLNFVCSCAFAQSYKLYGKITTERLETLAFVSVQVKGYQTGVISREDGTYELKLDEGRYEVVYSMIGFKPVVITVVIDRRDYQQNIVMKEEEDSHLSEVVFKAKIRDRSEEIIRNVIRQKDAILDASSNYSCIAYIKALQQDSSRVQRNKKKAKSEVVGQDSVGIADKKRVDSITSAMNRLAMAEVVLKIDVGINNRIREERTGVTKRGRIEDLFYLSSTEGNFNFYQNLLSVPNISQIPILSPISYSGLLAYRFKITNTETTSSGKVFTISVRPRQLSNATVEGELRIADSSWAILSTRFSFPSYHLPVYDFFEVEQQYDNVNGTWLISRQQFTYFSKGSKGKKSGVTTVTYKDFVLNKTFPKNHFGVELSSTSEQAYERDSSFWNSNRTEPLTAKELQFIQYKDSIYRATHSKEYLDSLDKVINKVTWKKILLFGQTFNNHEKESTWHLPPLPSVYQPLQFGGSRLNLGFFHSKTFKSRKNFNMSADVSYGFRNRDINGSLRFSKMYNPFNRGFYHFNIGRDFQYIFEGDAWINMLKRSNIYLNNSAGIGHGLELFNGMFLYSDIDIAFRRSVSDYKVNTSIDSLLPDLLENNEAVFFQSYNAVYGKLRLQYTPGQRYIRESKEKIILGSKWPTFYTLWRKGIPGILDSKVDFDYLEFGVEQELKLGLIGISRYNVKTGTFLNQRDLRLVDYQFQRRGDPLLFMNPHSAFQSLDSTFAVFQRFYQSHYVHEFNGAILNKIPFFKALKLREIAGGGFLIAPERNLRYVEVFGGIERVFNLWFSPGNKFKLGIYAVGSAANQFRNPVQFKVGITSWDKRRGRWF